MSNYLSEREDFFKEEEPKLPTKEDLNKVNMLQVMFNLQTELDSRIIKERAIERDLNEWVIGLTIAMESEIDEVRREVYWKWWKNPEEIDIDSLQEEVIDLWHFLLSLSRVVGLTPNVIYKKYIEKNEENHERQNGNTTKEGYKPE